MVCHGTGDSPLKCASDTLRKSEKVITQVPTPPQPRFLSHNRDTIKKENYTTEYNNFNTNAFFPRSRFCTHRCKSHKHSFAFSILFTTSSATSYRTPSYSHTKITILLAGNIKRRNLETHSPQYRGKSNQANSAFYNYRTGGLAVTSYDTAQERHFIDYQYTTSSSCVVFKNSHLTCMLKMHTLS